MAISVEKLAPRAVVLAVVGYCVWPTIMDLASKPDPKPPEKVPELAASALRPKMPPLPTRDPFGAKPAAKAMAARPATSSTTTAAMVNKAAAKLASRSAATKGPAGMTAAAKGPAGKTATAGTAAVAAKSPPPTAGLTLEATCIAGDQRMAVINGRLYRAQEMLAASNAAAPAYRLIDVSPHKVLLEYQGKRVELSYSDSASRPAGSGRPEAARPKSAASGKPKAASKGGKPSKTGK
jgi:hypothetical protein